MKKVKFWHLTTSTYCQTEEESIIELDIALNKLEKIKEKFIDKNIEILENFDDRFVFVEDLNSNNVKVERFEIIK